ncbi:unnamed protein product, partial [Polarella glacialis]
LVGGLFGPDARSSGPLAAVASFAAGGPARSSGPAGSTGLRPSGKPQRESIEPPPGLLGGRENSPRPAESREGRAGLRSLRPLVATEVEVIQDQPLQVPANCALLGFLGRIQDELRAVVAERQPFITRDQLLNEPREEKLASTVLWRLPFQRGCFGEARASASPPVCGKADEGAAAVSKKRFFQEKPGFGLGRGAGRSREGCGRGTDSPKAREPKRRRFGLAATRRASPPLPLPLPAPSEEDLLTEPEAALLGTQPLGCERRPELGGDPLRAPSFKPLWGPELDDHRPATASFLDGLCVSNARKFEDPAAIKGGLGGMWQRPGEALAAAERQRRGGENRIREEAWAGGGVAARRWDTAESSQFALGESNSSFMGPLALEDAPPGSFVELGQHQSKGFSRLLEADDVNAGFFRPSQAKLDRFGSDQRSQGQATAPGSRGGLFLQQGPAGIGQEQANRRGWDFTSDLGRFSSQFEL